MAPKSARRGVLMVASSRKPRSAWRDLPDEEDGPEDEAGDAEPEALAAKASQREWEEIAREVREEKRKRFAEAEFASGRRDGVVGYDDVAEDVEEPELARPPRSGAADEDEAEEGAAAGGAAGASAAAAAVPVAPAPVAASVAAQEAAATALPEGPGDDGAARARSLQPEAEQSLPPPGAVTAGQVGKKKKRGGKKPGSHKRRRDKDGEDDETRAKRKKDEEEESKRWLKLKLEGEEKPKRVKATRIVSYFDFDAGGFKGELDTAAASGASAGSGSAAAVAPAAAPSGNFRSQLRRDLFEDDSDGDEQ